MPKRKRNENMSGETANHVVNGTMLCHFEKKYVCKRTEREDHYHYKIDETTHCRTHSHYHIENI